MQKIPLDCSGCGNVDVRPCDVELFDREDAPNDFNAYFRFVCSGCLLVEVVPADSATPEDMAAELDIVHAAEVTYPYLEMQDPARRRTDIDADTLVDHAIDFHNLMEVDDYLATQALHETRDIRDLG